MLLCVWLGTARVVDLTNICSASAFSLQISSTVSVSAFVLGSLIHMFYFSLLFEIDVFVYI